MHTMQTCGLLLQMQRGLRVCLCAYAGHNSEPYKNGWTVDSDGPKEPGGGAEPAKGRGNFGGRSSHWNAVHYSVSSKCRSSTGLQTCLQGTAHHGESVASEWTHLPRGWQVQGRCSLSSKFFDHLSLLLLQLTDLRITEPLKAINRLIQQTARVNCEMQNHSRLNVWLYKKTEQIHTVMTSTTEQHHTTAPHCVTTQITHFYPHDTMLAQYTSNGPVSVSLWHKSRVVSKCLNGSS